MSLTQAAWRLRSARAGLTGPRPVGPSWEFIYSGRTALRGNLRLVPFSNLEHPLVMSTIPKHGTC